MRRERSKKMTIVLLLMLTSAKRCSDRILSWANNFKRLTFTGHICRTEEQITRVFGAHRR